MKVMAPVLEGRRTQGEAARLLKLGIRQVRRLQRRLKKDGDVGIVHKLRGRPSNRRRDPSLREQAVALYRQEMPGFSLTMASEKLAARKLAVPARALRDWLSAEGVWHPKYRRDPHRTRRLTGHLWQGRPFSCPLDGEHLWVAARYVERNPVRAGLVPRAEEYPWSSAAAHCGLRRDPLVAGDLERRGVVEDWASWLAEPDGEEDLASLRRQTRSGRPLGAEAFVQHLETLAGRSLTAKPVGRPKE
jgi:transposase